MKKKIFIKGKKQSLLGIVLALATALVLIQMVSTNALASNDNDVSSFDEDASTEQTLSNTDVSPSHAHTWNYTADGATITAKSTCQNDSGCEYAGADKIATLTLSATSPAYSGCAISKADLFSETSFASFNTTTGHNLSVSDIKMYAAGDTSKQNELLEVNEAGQYVAELTAEGETATCNVTVSSTVAECKHDIALTAEGGRLTTGNYFLEDNLNLTNNIVILANQEVSICLNGHTLSYKYNIDKMVPLIVNNGNLTIDSCQQGGKIECSTTDTFDSKTLDMALIQNEEKANANLSNITVNFESISTKMERFWQGITNHGSIAIDNCKFTLKDNASSISSLYGLLNSMTGEVTLKNSEINVSSSTKTENRCYGINNNQGKANLENNKITVNNPTGQPTGFVNNDATATLKGDSINVTGKDSGYGFANNSAGSVANLTSVSISASGVGLANTSGMMTLSGKLTLSGQESDLYVADEHPVTIASSGLSSDTSIKVKIYDSVTLSDKTGLFAKPETEGSSLAEYSQYFKAAKDAYRIITSTNGLELAWRITGTTVNGNTATVTVDTSGLPNSPTYQWSKLAETDLSNCPEAKIYEGYGSIEGNTIKPGEGGAVALILPNTATAISFSCTGTVYDSESNPIEPLSGTQYMINAGNLEGLYYGILIGADDNLTDVKVIKQETLTSETKNVISCAKVGKYMCTVTFADGSTQSSEIATISSYTINKADSTNGTFKVMSGSSEVTSAEKDTEITIVATPDADYVVDSAKYNDGTDHEVTKDSTGAYKFTMPETDVLVSVTFKKSENGEVIEPVEKEEANGNFTAVTNTSNTGDTNSSYALLLLMMAGMLSLGGNICYRKYKAK